MSVFKEALSFYHENMSVYNKNRFRRECPPPAGTLSPIIIKEALSFYHQNITNIQFNYTKENKKMHKTGKTMITTNEQKKRN